MTDHSTGRTDLSRRQVLRTAAWATPVIAAAVAAPMASASTGGEFTATGIVRSFQGNPNWTNTETDRGGTTAFSGDGYVGWQATITNDGPDTLPAGYQISFGMEAGRYLGQPRVILNASVLPFLQRFEVAAGDRSFWTYAIPFAIAPGTHTFNLRALLSDLPQNGQPQLSDPNPWEWRVYDVDLFIQGAFADGSHAFGPVSTTDSGAGSRPLAVYVNGANRIGPVPNTRFTPLPQI